MAKADKSATATNPPGDVAGAPPIDIGIDKGDRQKISDSLSKVLADAFTLYLKTHNFHWNVTGSMFNSLHLMFEAQYNEQWLALDEIAERIRALGAAAPASYAAYQKLTSIDPGVEGRAGRLARDGAPAHRGQRSGEPHRAQGARDRRQGRRRPERGHAHAALEGAREECVDAAVAAAVTEQGMGPAPFPCFPDPRPPGRLHRLLP
jgi:hypothetical protein